MKYKRITHYCKTLREAGDFQNDLYDKYTHVRLVQSPFIGEDGYYTWMVAL